MICWKPITIIGCQSNLSTERGGQMRKRYYDDAKENVAFERCVDVVTSLTAVFRLYESYCKKWRNMTMVEIAKRNNVSERTIYRYKEYKRSSGIYADAEWYWRRQRMKWKLFKWFLTGIFIPMMESMVWQIIWTIMDYNAKKLIV